jgi:F-type H+-transporting ATPase subunit epsilon
MTDQLNLRIITPERELLHLQTPWVTVPGTEGELGILPHHIPLVTTLDSGILKCERDGKELWVAVHYGYAQITQEGVIVLADMAETADDLDVARAKNAEQKARAALRTLLEEQQLEEYRMKKYESKLKRAMVRQTLLQHN